MGLDDEILRIFSLESMPKWNPGIIDGKPVNTLMVLPIRFKLKGEVAKSSTFFSPPSYASDKEVFDVVENMPSPQGGMEGWTDYVSKNLIYPKTAQEKGVEGTVYVSFIVDEDGSLQNPKILRGIGSGADEEAMRLVANAPKWTPGQQRGKNVPVEMKVPIKFELNTKAIGTPQPNQLDDVVVVGYNTVSIKKDDNGRPQKPAIDSSGKFDEIGEDPLYVINGEEYPKEDISKVSPEDIKSINVLKGASAIEKYEDNGKHGVIEITLKEGVSLPKKQPASSIQKTKNSEPKLTLGADPIFMVDDAFTRKSELKNAYDPEDIESISILKNGDAINLYGKNAQNGVVLITTKNNP